MSNLMGPYPANALDALRDGIDAGSLPPLALAVTMGGAEIASLWATTSFATVVYLAAVAATTDVIEVVADAAEATALSHVYPGAPIIAEFCALARSWRQETGSDHRRLEDLYEQACGYGRLPHDVGVAISVIASLPSRRWNHVVSARRRGYFVAKYAMGMLATSRPWAVQRLIRGRIVPPSLGEILGALDASPDDVSLDGLAGPVPF